LVYPEAKTLFAKTVDAGSLEIIDSRRAVAGGSGNLSGVTEDRFDAVAEWTAVGGRRFEAALADQAPALVEQERGVGNREQRNKCWDGVPESLDQTIREEQRR
jgi:hypothetical protein